jgi:hypothetical protein
MKFIPGIVLLVFAALSDGVIINCSFENDGWLALGNVYTFWNSAENSVN